MSHRTEQLESTLQRAIGQVLAAGLADPRCKGMISVTGVSVAADRRNATVKVSILPESAAPATMAALRHATGYVQHEAGERIRVRRMPELRFELDESLKKQADVLGAIHDAMAATGTPEPDDGEGEQPTGSSGDTNP